MASALLLEEDGGAATTVRMKAVGETSSRAVIVKGVKVVGLRVLLFEEEEEKEDCGLKRNERGGGEQC